MAIFFGIQIASGLASVWKGDGKNMGKRLFCMIIALLAIAAVPATADTFDYLLTSDHCTGNCLGGTNGFSSAGTIEVKDVTGGVTITVTFNAGYEWVNTGFDASFGFNLNGDPTISANP